MAYNFLTPIIGGQPIASKSTTAKHPLGLEVQAYDATYGVGIFRYCQGVSSTVVGSWVGITGLGVTTLAVANGQYGLGVSMSTNTTTGSYGWYQVKGVAVAKNLTSLTAGFLALTSTAGSLDDASVIGDTVFNAKTLGTMAVGLSNTFTLNYPYSANRVTVAN